MEGMELKLCMHLAKLWNCNRDAAKQREKKHIKQKRILQMKRAMEELKRMKDHQSSVQEEVSKLDSKLAELRPKIEQLHEQKKAIVLQVKSVCQ